MSPVQRRWVTAAFFFLSGLITASWSSRIPDAQDHLHLNNAAWGTVLVCLPIGMSAGLLISGWMVAHFGTKKTIGLSCSLAAFLLFLLGVAPDRALLMAALFFTGFSRTVLNIAMNANAVEVQQFYSKPIMSSFHGIWSLACLVAAGIGNLMISHSIPMALHFTWMAAICLAAGLLLSWRNAPAPVASGRKPLLVRPDRYLWLLGGIAFCGMIAENTMFDWSVNYFEKTVRAGKDKVTYGLTGFITTMTLGRLAGDWLTHHFGHLKMLVINGLLMAAGFITAACLPQLWPASLAFLLTGLGDATVVPIVYVLAARSPKMPAAYAITAVTMIGYVGFLIAPVTIGGLSELWGMRTAFGFVGALSLLIPLLAGILSARQKVQALESAQ